MSQGYAARFPKMAAVGLSKEVCDLPFIVQLWHRHTAMRVLCTLSVQLGLLSMVQCSHILLLFTEAACVGQSWPHQGSAPQYQSVYYRERRAEHMQCLVQQSSCLLRKQPCLKIRVSGAVLPLNQLVHAESDSGRLLKGRRNWVSRAFRMCFSSPHTNLRDSPK